MLTLFSAHLFLKYPFHLWLGCARNYNSTWGGRMANSEIHLYNLEEDPEEKLNLAKDPEFKEMVSRMISRFRDENGIFEILRIY